MKVKDLKEALKRLPPDMDDTHVFLLTGYQGERQYDLLAGVGYLPIEGHMPIALVGASEIQRQVEAGLMEKPEGYFPPEPEEGEEWKRG